MNGGDHVNGNDETQDAHGVSESFVDTFSFQADRMLPMTERL
jgi:hypothetical protein